MSSDTRVPSETKMNKVFATAMLLVLSVALGGCSSDNGDVVTNADQSAIEAYKAQEAAEQAALQQEMNAATK